MISNFTITIITLTKNDNKGFSRTFLSVINQRFYKNIEFLILDGSAEEIYRENKNIIQNYLLKDLKFKDLIFFNHINMDQKKIIGIYECMNYGLSKSKGKSIIFLNGGDSFFDDESLKKLDEFNSKFEHKKIITFGQANIISKIGLSWKFPGSKLKNIKFWLKFFEPNHQSMLVSSDIAKFTFFKEESKISADKFWKREVISKANQFIYINFPICNFFLEGYSSKRPNRKILLFQLNDKNISKVRKFITIIKFLIIPPFYKYYAYIQKFKSLAIDLIF